MDALFVPLASALGASVDQIKVRSPTFYAFAANDFDILQLDT